MSILDQAFNQLVELLPKLGSEKRCRRRGHHRHHYHRNDNSSYTLIGRVRRWSGLPSRAAAPEVPEQRHSISLLPVSAAVAHASCQHPPSRVVHEQLFLTYVDKQAYLSSSRRPGPKACHVMSLSNSDDDDDFVTPLQSLHTSRLGLATPLSRTTSSNMLTGAARKMRRKKLYLSASDIPILESCASAGCSAEQPLPRGASACQLGATAPGDPHTAHMDDLQLITHQNHSSPELEDHHELTTPQLNGPNYSFTLRDGVRSIDFVLVWQESSSSSADSNPVEEERQLTAQQLQKRQQKKDMLDMHAKRRRIFEGNLMEEGIVLEEDQVSELPLRFVKIHAPMEVCCRYAEILKLRMPMKEKLDQCFLKQRFILHFPGLPALEISAPAVLQDVTDVISRMFNFVRNNPAHFPPMDRHFTAVYSRDKEYLFNVNEDFFSAAHRARIIDFILRRKRFCADDEEDDFAFGIEKLINDSTYIAAYPIHEGDVRSGQNARVMLFKHWASIRNFYKYQPLDHIKRYFGVKIALYFAWLGFYTYMLIPASIVGFLCFLYAASTINLHQPSNDICNKELARSIEMCPLCDKFCGYWNLNDTCFHAKFTYLVDNPATVFFAVFMSFWAALFLEMWKRYSAEISHRWDLTGFDIQEEHPRPQYLARLAHIKKKTVNIVTKTIEPRPPFWRMRVPGVLLSTSSVLLLVMMAFVAVVAVILYRMSMLAALSIHGDTVITSYAIIFTSTTAALINLVCIMIFNQVYARMAEYLTEMELQRTQTEFDDSLTLKIYLLQFINYYASIFYIAFVKGKMVGYPGDYNRFFGSRQEECSPGGCLLELSVQLAIIMVGKQAMNTVVEMILPKLWQWYKMLTVPQQKRDVHTSWPQWAKDFKLIDFDPRGLFPEYLEIVLQYGFVTIFVSSFPLAPLFAFVNNVLEVRLDAKKLLTNYRRPVPQRVKDIGVWFRILDSIGKFAVITNGFIIAFTSNFIPELVYIHVVSPDNTLNGFLNHSLSVFDVDDYPPQYKPPYDPAENVTECRYPDYRNPPDSEREYKYAPIFWHILAARFAFVVVFENVVCVVILLVKWLIPDMPYRLKEQIRREAYMTNELIVEQELQMAREAATLLRESINTSPTDGQPKLRRQNSAPPDALRERPRPNGAGNRDSIKEEEPDEASSPSKPVNV